MTILCRCLILAICLVLPRAAFAQHAEGDDVQQITPPNVRPSPTQKKPDLSVVVKQIVQKTNEFRSKQGQARVDTNAKLTKTAESFAAYMAKTDRYGHTADGQRPADRVRKHGYDYCIVLENIAYQYNSRGFTSEELSKGFFEGWKESPGHRKNMLDPDVTETGVAVARSENTGYFYAVQLFGRPKSKAIEFKIVNQAEAEVKYVIGDESFTLPPNYTRTHTRCRPPVVNFQTGGKDGGKTVKPEHGDRLQVTGSEKGLQMKTQKAVRENGR